MMNPRKGARLYAPDLDAIHGLARAGFLSADQLRRHFYPQSSERTTTNRLAQLAREGFFTRTASFPHSTPQSIGRPIYVYYWDQRGHLNRALRF